MSNTLKDSNEEKKIYTTGISKLLRIQELGLLGFIVAFCIFITIIDPTFLYFNNIISILRSSVFIFIIGCGMTFVLVGGEIDLSVGSVFGFTAVAFSLLLHAGINIFLSMIITLILGIIVGLITGLIIVRFKIPALIVTLGMLYIYSGIIYGYTKVRPISVPQNLEVIGYGDIFGIPYLVIIAVIVGIISHAILNYTSFGYNVRCVGGNKLAAVAGGINVNRTKITLFMITGLLSALAGILIIFRLSAGKATIGEGYELYVISAVIIGGSSIYGGIGTVFGSFLGALLISIIMNGMMAMRVDPYWQSIFIGLIMIIAVGLDQLRRRKMWQVS